MSLKLNVGLSKKIGMPNYGSLGASCHLEIDLDQSLLGGADIESLQRCIRQAYGVCEAAVREELSRESDADPARRLAVDSTVGQDAPSVINVQDPGDTDAPVVNLRATQRQLAYARRLAGQIPGLGIRRLDQFAEGLSRKPLADLSAAEASHLIDALKAIKDGAVNLPTAATEFAY